MNDETDESVASRVIAGDVDAFAELVDRYEGKLRRYARKFLSQSHEIDDLVQDVFIKAYTNLQSFDTTKPFSPWIYRIAHNTFVNELKAKSRRQFLFDADTIFPQLSAVETADGDALNRETFSELMAHLDQLPPKYKEVLILYYFEYLSYQDISDVLSIPVTTVGVRINRARQKLRDYYQSDNSSKYQS